MNTIVTSLLAEASEWEGEFLCFWGHSGSGVGPWCLSQWHLSGFECDGRAFPTAEHWMMVQKAELFGDRQAARNILADDDPGRAKALGRGVRGFHGPTWDRSKFSIVATGNALKFSQNPLLADYLLSTAPRPLVEASPVDLVWGVGLSREDPRVHTTSAWRGQNLLGFALMRVRSLLALADPSSSTGQTLLPPWAQAPDEERSSTYWRMGGGESYLMRFCVWWRTASEKARAETRLEYPERGSWWGWYDEITR